VVDGSAPSPDDTDTVLNAAALLHENGQSTTMTLISVNRLNRGLDSRTTVITSWASLLAVDDGTAARAKVVPVAPIAVNMRRVATVMQIVDAQKTAR